MLKAISRTVPIEEIKIPNAFAQTTPAAEKVETRKAFFKITGQFDRTVILNENNYLFDGYSVYIAAIEMGLETLSVVQIARFRKRYPKKTKSKIVS